VEQIPTEEEVLVGMFFLNERPIIILFDSGASHNFMSSTCAKKAKLTLVQILSIALSSKMQNMIFLLLQILQTLYVVRKIQMERS
jgi:hypothetical protein